MQRLVPVIILSTCVIFLISYLVFLPRSDNKPSSDVKTNDFKLLECASVGKRHTIDEAAANASLCDIEIKTAADFDKLSRMADKLVHLRSIYLRKTPNTAIPPEIKKLINLRVLTFHHTFNTVLPSEIGLLNSLATLKIEQADMSDLPEEISTLDNLENLIIIHNEKPVIIPDTVGKLPKLKTLIVNDNPGLTIQSNFSESPIEEINIKNNRLREIPATIYSAGNLKVLNASGNRINRIPKDISSLSELKGLQLRDNSLAEFSWMSSLTNLESVDLGNNRLAGIPNEIRNLKKLKYLNLSGNNILKSAVERLNTNTHINIVY